MSVDAECHICRLTGGDDEIIEGINTYITDNVGKVSMKEIISQVFDVLNETPETAMTRQAIQHHIEHHVIHQKVIMSTVLQDLLKMSHATKKASLVACEETGQQKVDNKMLGSYLKIVDQIITVYRMEGMKEMTT